MVVLRPKTTVSSVRGRIQVTTEDGERVGPWGGTECFLSRQTGEGPCLVVRSSRHKRNQGTFFHLAGVQQVLSSYAMEGKLTVVVPHQKRICSLFIETLADVDALQMMAAILQDRSRWKDIEKNVACRKQRPTYTRVVDNKRAKNLEDNAQEPLDYRQHDWDRYDNDSDAEDIRRETIRSTFGEAPVDGVEATLMGRAIDPFTTHNDSDFSKRGDGNGYGFGVTGGSTAEGGKSWTAEQKNATCLVRTGRNVFVTGPAGTGKTEWLLHMIKRVLPRGEATVVTASTGMSARMLGGCTIHSFAGIGRGEGGVEKVFSRVKSKPEVVRAWRQCQILIIDEIGNISPYIFTVVDEIAKRVREAHDKPFGGIQVILLGDFLQLPPVDSSKESCKLVDNDGVDKACIPVVSREPKWCFETAAWEDLKLAFVEFRKNYRQVGDPDFALCLEDIRFGLYTERVESIMKECMARQPRERQGIEPTMIVARRNEAVKYNTKCLELLEDIHFHRYESEDYASIPGMNLEKEVSLQQFLELRVGAQVVLLASLPNAPHLSNGDQGVVVSFAEQARGPSLPVVCFATSGGEEVLVPRVSMEVLGPTGAVIATRTQIPLQLAWAMTVHRTQGMTLPLVNVRLDRDFFDCGQAYVALSRVRSREDLVLSAFVPSVIFADDRAVAFYRRHFPGHHRSDSSIDDELIQVKDRIGAKRPRLYEETPLIQNATPQGTGC